MIAGVILAAGQGRRFGAVKQLATLDGESLLQRAIDTMTAVAELTDVVVVLGAHAREISAGLNPGRARAVHSRGWAEGQAASLRTALRAIGEAQAMLITLADQPFVTSAAIRRVLAARGDGAAAVRACYGGVPGHPVLVERSLFGALMRLRGDVGARALLADSAVTLVACEDIADARDVDTPAALRALARRGLDADARGRG